MEARGGERLGWKRDVMARATGVDRSGGAKRELFGLARLIRLPLDALTRLGLSRAALLRDIGLSEADIRDPEARIPLACMARLWRAASAGLPGTAIGLRVGASARARDFGLVGYTLVYSDTLLSALKRLDRYDRIISDSLRVELDTAADAAWLRLDAQPALRSFRPAADARLASVLSVCREITGAPIVPLHVQFPYRRLPDVREYERLFQAPLEFGAANAAILFSHEDLARPVTLSDETLVGYLDRLARAVLSERHAGSTIRDQVRHLLWTEMNESPPDIERIARRLAMTPRTLQRRLRQEETSFAAVLEELRRDMAPSLLREGRMSVSEVAFLLGYEDPSSFQRAFRRWFGLSPRAFRGTTR